MRQVLLGCFHPGRRRLSPFYHHWRTFSAFQVDLDTGTVSKGKKPMFQTVIGMEIHAQLDIATKLFSPAPRDHSAPPNTCAHPLDVAMPGILPVISQQAVQAAVLTAAACQTTIQTTSRFERKHYFYADLPQGYQITQQRWPLATNGHLKCRKRLGPKVKQKQKHKNSGVIKDEDKFVTVRIDRIQIEQDTGKTTAVMRKQADLSKMTDSLVDFNRAGCALVEIVFYPDLRSAHDAAAVVTTLRQLLLHVGACDGKMEEGSLRCDLNISVAPFDETDNPTADPENPFGGALPAGTGHRVEVKNLNSIKQVIQAAEFEARRQAEAMVEGKPTGRETRTFDVKSGKTITIRTKEGAVDYRFLPEPDLPPLILNEQTLGLSLGEFIAKSLPELPEQTFERIVAQYNLPEDTALIITNDKFALELYEDAVEAARSELPDADKVETTVANWLSNNLFALLKEVGDDDAVMSVQNSTVSGKQLGGLVVLLLDGTVSTPMAKKILHVMFHEEIGKGPREIAEERGWKVISDASTLQQICTDVVMDPTNTKQLEQYKKGGKQIQKMEKFFVGKAMGAASGNADPELLQDALQTVLQGLAAGGGGGGATDK